MFTFAIFFFLVLCLFVNKDASLTCKRRDKGNGMEVKKKEELKIGGEGGKDKGRKEGRKEGRR